MGFAAFDEAVNRLAHHLVGLGIRPGARVGIYLERSIELVVAAVAIWRAGAAYVPLDPAYPADRVAFMAEDAGVEVVLSQSWIAGQFPASGPLVIALDREVERLRRQPSTPPMVQRQSDALAYVIYTSGSSGTPKGVMVEHRNVLNFFTAMDAVVARREAPPTWLAVTSLNFDISVLELFYTLARGFTVILHVDEHDDVPIAGLQHPQRRLDFGLFYFSSDAAEQHLDKYRLLLDGARFAVANGFRSVWTPERHFHAFGGLYPNPAVTGAAVAAVTKNVDIRAGSCVTPLHHPVRVAEDWSVVDGLSNGRVGLSIAAGWQPNDFVLRPENYADRKAQMFRDIDVIQKLWRGEAVPFRDGTGTEVASWPSLRFDDRQQVAAAAADLPEELAGGRYTVEIVDAQEDAVVASTGILVRRMVRPRLDQPLDHEGNRIRAIEQGLVAVAGERSGIVARILLARRTGGNGGGGHALVIAPPRGCGGRVRSRG
jgi:hypothetical protein